MKRGRITMASMGLLAMLAAIAPSSGVRAATPTTPYEVTSVPAPDQQVNGFFGDSLATADDLDGDGVADFFAAAPLVDLGGVTDQGRVWAMSGRDRRVLFTIDSPEPQAGAQFGFFLAVFGDANRDGTRDVAVGTDAQNVYTGSGAPCGAPEPNGCNERQGRAWVFSGAGGGLLYAVDNPVPQGTTTNRARFGSRLGAAGDVTGDGVGDLLAGAPYNDKPAACGDQSPLPAGCHVDEGQAFVFDGATGALVRTLDFPAVDRHGAATCTASCGWFGLAVQGPGDVSGDGVVDHLVDAASWAFHTGTGAPCGAPEPNGCNELQGRMYLFSGANGELLRRIDTPFPDDRILFGFQDAAPLAPGDVTGDGVPDLYGSASEEGAGQGQGYVFDGRTGAFLYALKVPGAEPGDELFALGDVTDFNRDGTPDLYVGNISSSTLPLDESGGTFVFDGRNGALLRSFVLPDADREPGRRAAPGPPPDRGPFLGWSVIAPGDLNGDGEPDYVAGAVEKNEPGLIDAGRLYVFASTAGTGYRMVASDGGVFAFGASPFLGSTGGLRLNQPVVALAVTPSDAGYWLVAADGGVFAFGDARFLGSTGALRLNRPVVGAAATPTGAGYWLVASDGGVFAFGDARFLGSTAATPLNQPVVGMAPTPTGRGYWLVASDGGVFAFGDARFHGSTGATRLNRPIVGMAPTPTGRGYWLVASDGGVFAFGDARFHGSAAATPLSSPAVGITPTRTGKGYWLVSADGGAFAFGDARFLGSLGATRLARPVVGIAAR